jgi:GGDEF domain-containing protein
MPPFVFAEDEVSSDDSSSPQFPNAKPGPYKTSLPPDQEQGFQSWVKQNKVPWQDTPNADYDMRGYYKAMQSGDVNAQQKQSGFDGKMHFPDTYKTPYHKTFSNESQYATPDAPHWDGDRLIDKGGKVVADETPKRSAKPMSSTPVIFSDQDIDQAHSQSSKPLTFGEDDIAKAPAGTPLGSDPLGPGSVGYKAKAAPRSMPSFSDVAGTIFNAPSREAQAGAARAASPQSKASEAAGMPLAPVAGAPKEPTDGFFTNPRTGQRVPLSAVPETDMPIYDPARPFTTGPEQIAGGVGDVAAAEGQQAPDSNATFTNPRTGQRVPLTRLPEAARRQEMSGIAETIKGVGDVSLPLVAASGVMAPARTALGFGAGLAASEGAGAAVHGHVSPEDEDLIRTLSMFAPSALGVVSGLKSGTVETPQGKFSAASIFGGKAGAGVRTTPEGTFARVKVGGTTIEVPISRNGSAPPEAAAPAPPPARITQAIGTMANVKATETMAKNVAQGLPPTPPAPPPPPTEAQQFGNKLSGQQVDHITQAIAAHPPEARNALIEEARNKLTQWIAENGGKVFIDGRVYLAKDQSSAGVVAQKIINDSIDAHDKQAKESGGKAENVNGSKSTSEPSVSPVKPVVERSVGDEQVLGPIVRSNPVDMVDMLGGKKAATDNALHDKPVLQDVPAVDSRGNHVPPLVNVGLPHGSPIAGLGAERSVGMAEAPLVNLPASGASENNPSAPLQNGNAAPLGARNAETSGTHSGSLAGHGAIPTDVGAGDVNGVPTTADLARKANDLEGAKAPLGTELPADSHGRWDTKNAGTGLTDEGNGHRENIKQNTAELDVKNFLSQSRPKPQVFTEQDIQPERRSDLAKRKRLDEMTEAEKDKELTTAPKTGLPNSRAFDESGLEESHPHVGFADVDDFKSFNTAFGHKGVDTTVLPAIGDMFRRAVAKEPTGHIHAYQQTAGSAGDEFLMRSKTPEAVKRVVERVNKELAETEFEYRKPDGTIVKKKGTGLKHGIGDDPESAEADSEADKQRRTAAGLRSGERDVPAVDSRSTAGERTPVSDAAGRTEVHAEGKPAEEITQPQTFHESEIEHELPEGVPAKGKSGDSTPPDIQLARTESGKIKLGADVSSLGKVLGSSLYQGRAPKIITKELIQNAFDAVRSSGNKEIHVDLDTRGPDGIITVSDTGKGMSKDELETVFTDLGSSGKRGQEDASGGFGLAKAAPLMMSKRLEIKTVVDEGGQRLEHSFVATPEQMLGEGVDVSTREVGRSVPTGTAIKAFVDKSDGMWSAEAFVRDSRKSLNAPGELSYSSNGKDQELQEHQLDKQPMAKAAIPGAEITIYRSREINPIASAFGALQVEIHNNGIYQFDNAVYNPGAQLRGMPTRVAVDVHATVPEGDKDYPFLANRESLRGAAQGAINEIIKREIIQPAVSKEREIISQLYHSLPTIAGTKMPLFDAGGRFKERELKEMQSNPVVREIADKIQSLVDRVITKSRASGMMPLSATDIGKTIKRVGLVFSDKIHGVFITDPKDSSHATLLIDPFNHVSDSPWNAASLIWHTIKHEIVHDVAKGHDETFTTLEKDLSRSLGQLELHALRELSEVYGDPNNQDRLRPDINRPLQIYRESRGRPEAQADIFGGENLRRGGEHEPDREDRNAGSVRESGTGIVRKGDSVTLPDGREGTVQYVHPEMNIARVKTGDGKTVTVGLKSLKDRSGEAGFAKLDIPSAVADMVKAAHEKVFAPTENRIARGVDDTLYQLGRQYDADVLRTIKLLKSVGPTTSPEDQEAIYHHKEDDSQPLTERQENTLETVVQPLMDANSEMRSKLNNAGVPMGEDGYIHRVVQGKNNQLERAMNAKGGTGKGNVLSKSASSLKGRTMLALEDDAGERIVISRKHGRIVSHVNGEMEDLGPDANIGTVQGKANQQIASINRRIAELKRQQTLLKTVKGRVIGGQSVHGVEPTFTQRKRLTERIDKLERQREELQNAPDGQTKIFTDSSGKQWNLTQATTKEIELHTDLRYYKNALASTVTNYLQLRRAERAYDALEAMKEDPEFKSLSFKPEHGEMPPDGWRTVNLPQFNGYYFEKHLAETLDRFADELRMDPAGIMEKAGNLMTASLVLNPARHVYNIGNHWLVERGVSGNFNPLTWPRSAKAGIRAIKTVMTQNDDFVQALDRGAPMMSHRQDLRELHKHLVDSILGFLDNNPTVAKKIAEATGFPNPLAMGKALYGVGQKLTWMSNDMFFLQSIYEKELGGMSFEDAAKETARHIPDYRIPSRVLNSHGLSTFMNSHLLTVFSRYHYGVWKSYGQMLKEVAGPDSSLKDRAKGLDHMLMLGLLTFVGYELWDKLLKHVTGDPKARMVRSGASAIPYLINEIVKGNKPPDELIQGTFTPAVLPKTAYELATNRDSFSGSRIYDRHDPAGTIARDIGKKVGGALGPTQQYQKAERSDTPVRDLLAYQAGVTFPNSEVQSPAVQLMHELLRENMAMTPDLQKQLDDKKARAAAGRLTVKEMRSAAKKQAEGELMFLLPHLNYSDIKKVSKVATPEEQQIIKPIMLKKALGILRNNPYQAQEQGVLQDLRQ